MKVTELKKYKNNAKRHSEKQIKLIAEMIKLVGFNHPIVIDSNKVIIAGHGRLMAAQLLEMEEVSIIKAEDLTEEQIQAYRLADNKLTESPYDLELLKFELMDLNNKNFDLSLLGFNEYELEAFIGKQVNVSEYWRDMPEYNQDDLTAQRQIIISFKNEEDVQNFSNLLGQPITEKTKSLWFPRQEQDIVKDTRY